MCWLFVYLNLLNRFHYNHSNTERGQIHVALYSIRVSYPYASINYVLFVSFIFVNLLIWNFIGMNTKSEITICCNGKFWYRIWRRPLRMSVWFYRIWILIKGSSWLGHWKAIVQNMKYWSGYSEILLRTWLQRQLKRHILEAGVIRRIRCNLSPHCYS